MHRVEAISIEFQNLHPLAGDVLTLPLWITPCHEVVAQRWPVTCAMDFAPVQT
ncbi:MAG: hypothetical protein U9Q19_04420 [Pseudomonadota bacterium]|nr:hypothetical protein [Pseudomonadota bacterium]